MDLVDRLRSLLGADEIDELVGGHQSRVFRVIGGDRRDAVAKLLDATTVDRAELETRLDAVAALAARDPRVCAPLPIGGGRITELTSNDGQPHYCVCYEFAGGVELDPATATDSALMGAALSELHESMRQLPAVRLPMVSALRTVATAEQPAAGPHQLLHGDFNAGNLRRDGDIVKIFDLDDCGYGPPEFDVANALYMALFDAVTQGAAETYEAFRQSFVDGYVSAPGPTLAEESLDRFVTLRVRTLSRWLDDLPNAPVGIRNAPPAWHATLRSFVGAYRPTRR